MKAYHLRCVLTACWLTRRAGLISPLARTAGGRRGYDPQAEAWVCFLANPAPPLHAQTSEWASGFVGTQLTDVDGSAVLGLTGGRLV